jgi:O-antigen/teichoic acid export membrane protein
MKQIKNHLSTIINLGFSKTAWNTYIVSVGNGFSVLFAFVFTVTLVRVVSIENFGYFSAILSFLLLSSDMSDIGIGSSLSTFIPPLEKNLTDLLVFVKSTFLVQMIIGFSVMVAIFIVSPFLSTLLFHRQDFVPLFRITAVGIFGTIMANFFQYVLMARQKFIKASIVNAMGGSLRFLLLIVIMLAGIVTLVNVVTIQMVSLCITAMVAFSLVGKKFLFHKSNRRDIKKLLGFTAFLGASRALTAVAGRLDVLMLIAISGARDAGIYSTASRVISVYPLFSGSFSSVIAPKISVLSDPKQVKKFLIKIVLATLGLIGTIFIFILISHPFMVILFGPKAEPAVGVLRLLLISMIFFVASVPSVSIVIYHLHKPQILTVNSILQLVIVVISNLFLIPRFGKYGPALSLIIAYSVTLILTTYLAYRFFRLKHG